MPIVTIDNRPPQVQFNDGNGLSDGIAAFHAAVLNAGPAAAKIRADRQQQDIANQFQAAQGARADRGLDMQQQFHQQAQDAEMAHAGAYAGDDQALQDISRQAHIAQIAQQFNMNDERDLRHQIATSQINDRAADNARQTMGQWGTGLNNAAERAIDVLKLIYGHHNADHFSAVPTNDFSGNVGVLNKETGEYKQVSPNGPAQPKATMAPPAPASQSHWYNPWSWNSDASKPDAQNRDTKSPGAAGLNGVGSASGDANSATRTSTAPALRNDTAPRLNELLPILANPKDPQYAGTIAKIKAWKNKIDPDTGKPFPDGPKWAATVLAAMQGKPNAAAVP